MEIRDSSSVRMCGDGVGEGGRRGSGNGVGVGLEKGAGVLEDAARPWKRRVLRGNEKGNYGEAAAERALRAVEMLDWKILTSSLVSARREARESGGR